MIDEVIVWIDTNMGDDKKKWMSEKKEWWGNKHSVFLGYSN